MIEQELSEFQHFLDPFEYLDNSQYNSYHLGRDIEQLSSNENVKYQTNLNFNENQNGFKREVCFTNQQEKTINTKEKRIAKRQKAKNKVSFSHQSKVQFWHKTNNTQNNLSKQQQIKRKKRMSAQLSRDKRKQYMRQIQIQNQNLKLKCQQLELQNQKLKKSQSQSYFSFDFGFNKIMNFKRSLKSWFIMSLILLSIHKQGKEVDYNHKHYQKYYDSTSYLQNVNNVINEYEKTPIAKRIINLEHFRHFNDLDIEAQSKQVSENSYQNCNVEMQIEKTFTPQLNWNNCLRCDQSLL